MGQSNIVLGENTPLASAVIYLCCGRYNNDIFISARFNRCPVELKRKVKMTNSRRGISYLADCALCWDKACVPLVSSPPALQFFFLTFLQLQPPAPACRTVFFSHSTPASSSSLPNTVKLSGHLMPVFFIDGLFVSC